MSFTALIRSGTLLLLAVSMASADSTRDKLDKAWAEYTANHNDVAARLFGEVIASEPKNTEALAGRGAANNYLGRPKDGIPDLEKSVQLDPSYLWGLKELASAYANAGSLDKAAETCREAIRKGDKSASTHGILGAWLLQQKEYKEAEAELTLAVDLLPDYVYALERLGELYNAEGRTGMAYLFFREEVRVSPQNTYGLGQLADLCIFNLNRVDEGIDLAKSAAQLNPKTSWHLQTLVEGYVRKGMAKEALVAARAAVSLDPNSAFTHKFLAEALHCAHQDDEAKKEVKKALEIDPSHAGAQSLAKELSVAR